jgi:Pyruvate/2-oxoacid:ferredoxin oxidoreductase delta subunit
MAATKKPLYASLRYLFHLCLFIVPIWLSGHIVLWSESRFEWDWTPLPEPVADGMTLACLILVAFFLLRRLISPDARQSSSTKDILLIFVSSMPFLTCYFLTHGTLRNISILGDNMALIHMLSGELMLLTAIFLFYCPRLSDQSCVGCAACAQSCPTETLVYEDQGDHRHLSYAHFQCICCGTCIRVCPENASEMRHEINARRFVQLFTKREIHSVALQHCKTCNTYFAPEPQMGKIASTYAHDYLNHYPICRKTNVGEQFLKMSPWHRPREESA